MATYLELKAQADALLKQAEELRQSETAAVIADIKDKMAQYGLTARDLGLSSGASSTSTSRKKRTDAGSPLPAKYKDGNGNSWSGRGIKPKWLQEAIAKGKKIEQFAV